MPVDEGDATASGNPYCVHYEHLRGTSTLVALRLVGLIGKLSGPRLKVQHYSTASV